MTTYCGIVLFLLVPLFCPAAEIVAWKVPLSCYADAGIAAEGIARFNEAPEPSPFFKSGDELWNLKHLDPQQNPGVIQSPEWIVWNATSGRLIAKAGWRDIVRIHQLIKPGESSPARCRLKLEVFEVPPAGGPLAEDAVSLAEVTFFTLSSQKVSGEWSALGKSINYTAETTFNTAKPVVDTRLELTVKVPEQADLSLKTFVLLKGKPLWIARDSDGRAGVDIRVSAAIELWDGTPVAERILIQKGDQAVALTVSDQAAETQNVEGRGGIASMRVAPSMLMECLAPSRWVPDADPFAEPAENASDRTTPSLLPDAKGIKPPDFLRPWLEHEVLDARAWFKEIAPWSLEDDFLGYDPIQERLYHYSPEREEAGKILQLFLGLGPGERRLVVTTFEGVGQTRLMGQSGIFSSLKRKIGNKPVRRFVEIEPQVGSFNEVVDLRFVYEDLADPQQSIRINSRSTLVGGKPQELFSGKAGEEVSSLRVTAEIIPVSGE